MKVTKRQANEDMAWRLIDNSRPTMAWLRNHVWSTGNTTFTAE